MRVLALVPLLLVVVGCGSKNDEPSGANIPIHYDETSGKSKPEEHYIPHGSSTPRISTKDSKIAGPPPDQAEVEKYVLALAEEESAFHKAVTNDSLKFQPDVPASSEPLQKTIKLYRARAEAFIPPLTAASIHALVIEERNSVFDMMVAMGDKDPREINQRVDRFKGIWMQIVGQVKKLCEVNKIKAPATFDDEEFRSSPPSDLTQSNSSQERFPEPGPNQESSPGPN